jgi:hypothetical protein
MERVTCRGPQYRTLYLQQADWFLHRPGHTRRPAARGGQGLGAAAERWGEPWSSAEEPPKLKVKKRVPGFSRLSPALVCDPDMARRLVCMTAWLAFGATPAFAAPSPSGPAPVSRSGRRPGRPANWSGCRTHSGKNPFSNIHDDT